MFDKIRRWYKLKLWTIEMVMTAFNKGLITEEQLSIILNEEE